MVRIWTALLVDLGRQGAAERDRGEEGIRAGEREGECEMFKRLSIAGSRGGSSVSSIVRGTEDGGRERAIVNGVRASFCEFVSEAKLHSDFRLPGHVPGVAVLLCRPGLLRLTPPGLVWQLRLCSAGSVS